MNWSDPQQPGDRSPLSPRNPEPPGRRPLLSRSISPEAGMLAAICLVDLVTTLYWISRGEAHEGNQWMARVLELGPRAFILVKVLTFAPALVLAEWYRPRNPELIARVMRWVILGYLIAYLLGFRSHSLASLLPPTDL